MELPRNRLRYMDRVRQHNTFTGRLTGSMLDQVFLEAAELAEEPDH